MKSKLNQLQNLSNNLNKEKIIDLPEGKKINEFTLIYKLSSDEDLKENYEKEMLSYENKKKVDQKFEEDYSKMSGLHYNSKNNYYLKYDNKPVLDLNKERIRLFGSKFVETNYSKCKLIIEDKELNLMEYYYIKNKREKKYFEIKLIVKEKITDFESMFKNCKNLLTCPDLNYLDTSSAFTFKSFFENCENLQILPKFLYWDTNNVTDMSSMFEGCKSLLYFPDLSKFEMSKVTDINSMFCNCSKIKFLPKINTWNTSKIKNMKNLFKGCIKLSYIPDISVGILLK